jgi:predicted negative regulator of RcsB-dependent stress response
MSRNALYLIFGLFAAAAAVAGYMYYQDQQKSSKIKINVGEGSLTIETK